MIALITEMRSWLSEQSRRGVSPRGANVHFEDFLEDGRIRFDYRMRPGVVQKSNALELMRSVGLDV